MFDEARSSIAADSFLELGLGDWAKISNPNSNQVELKDILDEGRQQFPATLGRTP